MNELNGTSPGTALATQFKTKAAAARKVVDLPIPGIPGDPNFKFTCILRRIDVLTLIKGSALPDRLKHTLLGLKPAEVVDDIKAKAEEITKERIGAMTIEDIEAIQAFQRTVAVKTCLAPKIVFEPTDDPEAINLDPDECEFGPQIVEALYNYGMNLSPDVPVATTDGGETTVKAVETFPDSAPGDAVPGDRPDGQELPPVSSGPAGNR